MRTFIEHWTEDVNRSDILVWVEEELKSLTLEEFGEVFLTIHVYPRKWGVGKE